MKFKLNDSFVVDTDIEPWSIEGLRIGLFGGPGSGKSWTASLFLEQFLNQGGTVVIFEPRAEYHVLKEKFDIVVFGGPYNKDADFVPSSPKTYAKAVVEQGVSIIFHTSNVEEEKLIDFTAKFVKYLLDLEETHKRPLLLVLEETQEYCPRSPSGHVAPSWVYSRMITAFKKCFLEGRKLNVSAIAISPRPQETNFTIRQLANLTFYGKFSPQDIYYIDSQCLKYYEHSFYKGRDLLNLKTGQFAVITSGRTLPLQRITEPRQTTHGAETPSLTVVAPHREETKQAVESLTKTITDALERERAEESELEKAKGSIKRLEKEVAEAWKENERLKQSADTLGRIKIVPSTPPQKEDVTFIDKVRSDAIAECNRELKTVLLDIRNRFIEVMDGYIEPTPSTTTRLNKANLWESWKDKMPNTMTAKIYKFLIDYEGAKFTRTEIATQLAYSSRTSGVPTALSWLRRNNLVKHEGDYYFV